MVQGRDRTPPPPAAFASGRGRQQRAPAALVLPRIVGAALAVLLLGVGAHRSAAADETPSEAMRQRVEALRRDGDLPVGAGSSAARVLIASIYEKRGFAPLWADARREQALLTAIETSSTHGLDPRDYHAEALRLPLPADAAGRDRRLPARDLLLTDAFVRLAYHLYFGKADPRALQHGWNFARSLHGADPEVALAQRLEAHDPADALERLAPQLPMYRDLRRALARLREIDRAGGWHRVDPGPKLEVGATGPRVRQVRQRLRAGGDLAGDDDRSAFDDPLGAAVRRFQARHGLEADGVVGPATLAALNVPVAERIEQVRANLERLRWVARELTGDYLLVDIAGFTAQLWLDEALAWQARVVVGRPYRTTPEFRAPMKYLVLNPDWQVPPTILREDVLPKIARDPAYLDRHEMRVVDDAGRAVDPRAIDWGRYRRRPGDFPYRIVQAPGADNPLGRIKFMFPNEHSVYLHDTPSRELFDKTVRAFSSGCIRTDKPIELAILLLDDAHRFGELQLRDALSSGRTQTLMVRRTVPVLLLYFTAVAGPEDELQFRPDLYGRDAPIIAALAAPFRFAAVDAGQRDRRGR